MELNGHKVIVCLSLILVEPRPSLAIAISFWIDGTSPFTFNSCEHKTGMKLKECRAVGWPAKHISAERNWRAAAFVFAHNSQSFACLVRSLWDYIRRKTQKKHDYNYNTRANHQGIIGIFFTLAVETESSVESICRLRICALQARFWPAARHVSVYPICWTILIGQIEDARTIFGRRRNTRWRDIVPHNRLHCCCIARQIQRMNGLFRPYQQHWWALGYRAFDDTLARIRVLCDFLAGRKHDHNNWDVPYLPSFFPSVRASRSNSTD